MSIQDDMKLNKDTTEEIKNRAYEWSVDYKPWEENLSPQEYARHGYEIGYTLGVADGQKYNKGIDK